jgi:post-segregation antitoxin (ccd killing protein)
MAKRGKTMNMPIESDDPMSLRQLAEQTMQMKIDNQLEKRDRRLQNNIFRNLATKMHHEEEEAAANVPLLTENKEPMAASAETPPPAVAPVQLHRTGKKNDLFDDLFVWLLVVIAVAGVVTFCVCTSSCKKPTVPKA